MEGAPAEPEGAAVPSFLNWRQAVPTLFTLTAMLAGFLSILTIIWGMHTGRPDLFSRAALLIMLAMILDGLDGNVARWVKGCSAFGAELDTYVDLTAFGIAPAILIFAVTFRPDQDPNWRMLLLPSAVALSGVVRLARFKVRDPLRGQGGYAGLPITANAAWVSLFVYISLSPPRDQFSLHHGPVAVLFLVGVLVFIVLQVTNLRYPKPTKRAFMFVPCVVLVALLWILYFRDVRWSARVAAAMILLGAVYVVFGPLFVRTMANRKSRAQERRAP